MKIEQALEHFVVQWQADGRAQHTVAQYRRHIRKLAQYVQEHEVEEIGHEDLARFLSSVGVRQRADGGPRKASSGNSIRSSIRVFFGYLHAAGYLHANPARLVRRASTGAPSPRGLGAGERERLLAALAAGEGEAAVRDRVLFELMLATGIRIGSALALDVGDLDLDEGTILLRRVKGDRQQLVFVPTKVVESLRAFVGERRSGALFCGQHGERVGARQVHRRLVDWCREAGITRPVSPHSLRHDFAMRIYEKTGDVLLVQAALGHASLESTAVYARTSGTRLRVALSSS